MSNTFGNLYRLTTFGESHGPAIGGVIDGILSGYDIDIDRIQKALNRRRPGQSEITTQRCEEDKIEILSGIFEGKTLGTPIGFIIRNNNQNSNDYLKNIYRPSHADLTYDYKYGIRDWRGGGRASARETACRVVAGEFAKIILESYGIKIKAYTSQIGYIKLNTDLIYRNKWVNPENNIVRCPEPNQAEEMIALIKRLKENGNSVGGIVTCEITGNIPRGLGEPIYNKLQAELSSAMMSINGVKGFEYGMGFEGCSKYGQMMNDKIIKTPSGIKTETNHSGGIQGGISNGMPIYFNVGFKPTATILREIETLDIDFDEICVEIKGRHDPCIVPRAVPVVEAMAAIVILDQILLNKSRNSF